MKIIVSESQYKFLLENIPVINQIIDKMSEVGYDGLDDKEKTILSDYSQWLQSGQKNEFKYEDDDDVGDQEVGKKIKTALDLRDNHKQIVINGELQNLGPVELVTNDVPKSFDKYIEYESSIRWDDENWDGYIEVDYDGNLVGTHYGLLPNDEESDYLLYEPENYISLEDEMGSLWDELTTWIEEVVIPQL